MSTMNAQCEVNFSNNCFYTTRAMFRNYISYTKPLSFDEWMSIDDDKKAAVLYVQFFDQITLAWYKLKTDAAIEEECVSEVMMYLVKNVPIIKENPSRFKPSYIYRVCYNCIYCKSIDPYKGQTAKTSWYNNTTSNIVKVGDDVIDLFDTLMTDEDDYIDVDKTSAREAIWKIIDDMGEDTAAIVDEILGGKKAGKRISNRREEIIDNLRTRLACYKEVFLND